MTGPGDPTAAELAAGVLSAAELAAGVVSLLRARSQTLATAESLTGGLVGATITEIAGASAVYRGGLITYATELKAELVGVSSRTLAADGPVSPTAAAEMAVGAASVCGSDWGLATTGVAGPDPQEGHPVGQVFVAVAGPARLAVAEPAGITGPRSVEVRELSLSGDRDEIRGQTVAAVLRLMLQSASASASAGG